MIGGNISLGDVLKFEEGYRAMPYLCSEDYVTVGIGIRIHNTKGLDPSEFCLRISPVVAIGMLNVRINRLNIALSNGPNQHIYNHLDADKQAIILSMAYQMGKQGLYKFYNTWRALLESEWSRAQAEALDSLWARQSPERAERHARVLGGESLDDVYWRLCSDR